MLTKNLKRKTIQEICILKPHVGPHQTNHKIQIKPKIAQICKEIKDKMSKKIHCLKVIKFILI